MAGKSLDRQSVISTLTQSELRTACEKLVKITESPPEKDYCYPFEIFASTHYVPNHRCLSQAEASAKLRAIERLTHQPIAHLLANGWGQLSSAQLLDIRSVLLTLELGERTQPLGDQPPAWCRLDEQLFRLAFTAWIKGTNFAATPRLHVLARHIGVDFACCKRALQKLRKARMRLHTPSMRWPPRIDLWLGDPPSDEISPPMARLWVSVRALRFTQADAASIGLLPANSPVQEQQARKILGARWSLREDRDDASASKEASLQFTICCRCTQMLGC